eukprot:3774731-Rhodomonas_salina.2
MLPRPPDTCPQPSLPQPRAAEEEQGGSGGRERGGGGGKGKGRWEGVPWRACPRRLCCVRCAATCRRAPPATPKAIHPSMHRRKQREGEENSAHMLAVSVAPRASQGARAGDLVGHCGELPAEDFVDHSQRPEPTCPARARCQHRAARTGC